jgi:hypothetical protein
MGDVTSKKTETGHEVLAAVLQIRDETLQVLLWQRAQQPDSGFGLVLRRRRSSPIRDDRVASSAFAPVRANATAVRAAFTAGATAVPQKNRVREAQYLYARGECSYALSSNP